jgi:hypothetical protein
VLPCVLQVFTTSVAVAGDIQVALVVQTITTMGGTSAPSPSSSNISSSEQKVACAMSGTLTMTSREYPGPGLSGEGQIE